MVVIEYKTLEIFSRVDGFSLEAGNDALCVAHCLDCHGLAASHRKLSFRLEECQAVASIGERLFGGSLVGAVGLNEFVGATERAGAR